ncbi:MAG: DUF4215 domain-containing protein, partial [Myxococcales bacterium]|nr:DUF4215 domain-containing protein [Myxococcales bacterium]
GFIQPGEECDDGPNNSNTGACTLGCALPVCGDGFVQPSNNEACDDGNMSNNDACLNTCVAATCGDGFVNNGVEECDDGNQNNNDGCNSMCKLEARRVFVTSTLYQGNLGGLAGADAKCQARAQAAGLPGTFLAWLSDNTNNPNTRFTKSMGPYVLVNGTKIANNYTDLTDGTLLAP